MGPVARLLVPRRARGHWDEDAFAGLRRRASWVALPLAVVAGFLVIFFLALVADTAIDDVLGAVLWAAVAAVGFFFLRRRIERRAVLALRKTVHLHPTGNLPPPDEPPPDQSPPGGPAPAP
jgi:high-affinity Fe2+/Pb2+ permease